MSVISKKLTSKIQLMKTEYQINKDIKHQGVKGGLNESELESIIRDVIPKRYILTRGIIENASGEQSNETDICIYDDEILPPYIKKDLAFIPVEAVKYNFEVKSTLNSTELNTTIGKFRRFKEIGGKSPTVLFSYATDLQSNELSRYYKNDDKFLYNPAISVLCISNKSYYYKETIVRHLKDFISNSEFIKLFGESTGLDISNAVQPLRDLMANDEALNLMSRSQFALLLQSIILMNKNQSSIDNHEITLNGIRFNDITFKIHRWVGVEVDNDYIELSFLSGISNTLSKENFGNYLLEGKVTNVKVYSICYEDMWGNISCEKFDESGLDPRYEKVSCNFHLSKDLNKLTFEFVNSDG